MSHVCTNDGRDKVSKTGLFGFSAAFLISIGVAAAGEPAAIVEDVRGSVAGIQQMDLLDEGRQLELGGGAAVTLGYLSSCVRETITGGKVTIGKGKSRVENGIREEQIVDCDGGSKIVSRKGGAEVAGAVFRKGTVGKGQPKPDWTLYSTAPFLHLSKPDALVVIERLDKDGDKPIEITVKGLRADLSESGVQLVPGGLYVLSVGSAKYVLKISPMAERDAPLLSRLVPM